MDVASGRVLRSFDPVGAPLERAIDALEALRERIAGGLSPLVNALSWGGPVDPDLVPPPSLPAYREFVAGLKQDLDEGGGRRALPPGGRAGLHLRRPTHPARVQRDCLGR